MLSLTWLGWLLVLIVAIVTTFFLAPVVGGQWLLVLVVALVVSYLVASQVPPLRQPAS